MPNPKLNDAKPTARRKLREESSSPVSLSGSSPVMQRRSKRHSSSRRNRSDYDKLSDASDDNCDNSSGRDELDRCYTKHSPSLYPSLDNVKSSKYSDSSPTWNRYSNPDQGSSDESHFTARSPCISRTGPSEQKPVPSKSLPVTPEKGSPGSRICPSPTPLEHKRKRGMMPILAIGFALILCLGILFLHHSLQNVESISDSKQKNKSLEEIHKDIKLELKFINSQLPQTKHFWVQLMGQLDTMMVQNPVQPAVILVVVPEDAEETAVCLLHKISQAVSQGFEDNRFVMYDVKSEVHRGHAHLKYDLYKTLLNLEHSHVAIVHNIEKIPGGAAMTFHAFCDNENAPFKQALIFLAISLPGKYKDLSVERLDNTIDDYLLGLWGEELMQKDVSAVVSRVANAPVLVKPEESSVLLTYCKTL